MKARFGLGFVAVIFWCSAAVAQPVTPSSPPVDQAPSQVQIDAALDLLNANHTGANVGAMLDALAPILTASIKREHPTADDQTIAQIVKATRDAVVARQDDMMRLYAIEYAKHFSLDELKALTDFYRSPVGQKYVLEIPALTREMTPVGVAWAQKVIGPAVEDAINKMRAQGAKI